MASFDLIDLDGSKVGTIDLSDAVFAAPVREHLLWEAVRGQLASRRRGTSKVKERGEVKATAKKMYKQKRTGNARHGNYGANLFVGGGVVHGPRPRDWTLRPPRKVRAAALRAAVSLRAREGNLLVVRGLALPEPKTRRARAALARIGAERSLIVEGKDNQGWVRATRNLPDAHTLAPEGLNVYDVLRFPKLVLTAETARRVEERLSASAPRRPR